MSDVEFKELKYGFKYGDATVERHISDGGVFNGKMKGKNFIL